MTNKTKEALKGIFGILLGLTVFLEYIPGLYPFIWLLQPFLIAYAQLMVHETRWYRASIGTLLATNAVNVLVLIVQVLRAQALTEELKQRNLIAGENFSYVVTVAVLPAIYKAAAIAAFVSFVIVFLECVILSGKRDRKNTIA